MIKKLVNNLTVIACVLYLCGLFIALYTEKVVYKPYMLILALISLGIYLGDKIDNSKK